jgi:hypothetical protein
LNVDLQSGRANVHVVPDHLGGPVSFGRREILVSLQKRRDVDDETVKSFHPIAATVPTPCRTEYCEDAGGRRTMESPGIIRC